MPVQGLAATRRLCCEGADSPACVKAGHPEATAPTVMDVSARVERVQSADCIHHQRDSTGQTPDAAAGPSQRMKKRRLGSLRSDELLLSGDWKQASAEASLSLHIQPSALEAEHFPIINMPSWSDTDMSASITQAVLKPAGGQPEHATKETWHAALRDLHSSSRYSRLQQQKAEQAMQPQLAGLRQRRQAVVHTVEPTALRSATPAPAPAAATPATGAYQGVHA